MGKWLVALIIVVVLALAVGLLIVSMDTSKGLGENCTFGFECGGLDCGNDIPLCENGKCTCPWREIPLSLPKQ